MRLARRDGGETKADHDQGEVVCVSQERICRHKPYGPYEKYFKRPLDFSLSLLALIVLSPLLLVLTVIGAVAMKGNPFFVQRRPGKISKKTRQEKIFSLIKFRTMSNQKDLDGKPLPDEQRINKYGKLLRSTSLDELPELVNILKGDMAIVGPRPLMVEYLPYYTPEEHRRHEIRPGLTGLAQINGRSYIRWEEIFAEDLQYVSRITLFMDIKIIFMTVLKVLQRRDIADVSSIIQEPDGTCYVNINGKMRRIHQPLNKEREKV